MSKINCSIDLNLLDKSKIVNHSNGARYYNFDVQEMKQPDQYGKTHTVIEQQSKEERAQSVPKNYLGKGKEFIFGDNQNSNAKVAQASSNENAGNSTDEPDDLPF